MRLTRVVMAIAALVVPAMASARSPAAPQSPTDERRLTPEQVEAVLAEAAAKRVDSERSVPVGQPADESTELAPALPIHGEVGFSIGSGGHRELFGTAVYPLGEDGVAAIHLNFVDRGRRRFGP